MSEQTDTVTVNSIEAIGAIEAARRFLEAYNGWGDGVSGAAVDVAEALFKVELDKYDKSVADQSGEGAGE